MDKCKNCVHFRRRFYLKDEKTPTEGKTGACRRGPLTIEQGRGWGTPAKPEDSCKHHERVDRDI